MPTNLLGATGIFCNFALSNQYKNLKQARFGTVNTHRHLPYRWPLPLEDFGSRYVFL